jgi:OOP family OmpA-OmpF porin
MTIKRISRHLTPNCAARATRASALALLVLGACAPAHAADQFNSDRPGGVDHPLLSRYQGSILYMHGQDALGKAQLVFDDKGKPLVRGVEGRISSRMYWAPKGRSPLEVYRNYRQALEAAGFQTVYACETTQCETAGVQSLVKELPRVAKWADNDAMVSGIFNNGSQPGFHYYSGKRSAPGGDTYVSVALVGGYQGDPVFGRVRQFVQIVEPARTELGKVTVDVKAIGSALKRDGRIALYGVTFATGEAVLRPESSAQLAEMAGALKAAPSMQVFVVGHTDNQGQLQGNTQLSQKRAEAVVAALSKQYGIAPARMLGRGVANLSPLATNDSEEGRARNRRVELVVR